MPDSSSPIDSLISLPERERRRVLATLTPEQAERLLHDWRVWARPEQLYDPDDQHDGHLWLAGRGFGKTRSGAEATHEVAGKPDL